MAQERKRIKNSDRYAAADAGAVSQASTTEPLSNGLRMLLSAIILLQLLAVVAEPFRFFTRSTRGTSPAADPARIALSPYIEFAYLNHGYFFFAPEPGPSHVIDGNLTLESGKKATVRFPDRNAQWPRLLYHRHFMLSENLHQLWVPPLQKELVEGDEALLREWRSERGRFEAIRDSMQRHLIAKFNATQATLDRVEHRLPSSDEVLLKRMRLNDKQLYITLPDAPLNQIPELLPEAGNAAPAVSQEEVSP